MAGIPPHVAEKIRSMGNVFNQDIVARTHEIYAPLIAKAPRDGVKVTLDVAYGPDTERHLLDIHVPGEPPQAPRPVIVFIHGGGFVRGFKNAVPGKPELAYGNIATYFARNGMVGVNATYRLAPQHAWPAGGEDVGSMVAWLRENVADHGGDPEQIFLFGQSAGAAHVATYLFHRDLHRAPGSGVAGAMLFSGVYDPAKVPPDAAKAYFGDDRSAYARMSAIDHVEGSAVPLFIVIAEYDPPMMEMHGIELLAAIARRDGRSPRFTRLKHHNHLSEALHLNTGDESIGPELIDFVKTRR